MITSDSYQCFSTKRSIARISHRNLLVDRLDRHNSIEITTLFLTLNYNIYHRGIIEYFKEWNSIVKCCQDWSCVASQVGQGGT